MSVLREDRVVVALGHRRDLAIAAAIAAAAALLPFHRGLAFPFALDDYTYLFRAAGLDPAPFSLRRWLAVSGYYATWLRLFGPNPFAWHVTSLLLHIANAVWVYAFARRFGASRDAAWIACGLFASSPLAFTVLYWAACIQELGSTFFLFAAVWALGREDRWRWASVGLFGLAVLCKESVIGAPLALPFLLGRRARLPAAAMLATGAALFLGAGLHRQMMHSDLSLPYATAYDQTLLVNLATQLVWFLAPWRTYPDRVAGPNTSMIVPAVAAVGAVVVALVVTRGRHARSLAAAGVWYVATLLPVLPLRQHSYAYYSYAPQAGFLILAASGLLQLGARLGARSETWRLGLGVAAVSASVLFAAWNTRTHENLKLQKSVVPHDTVVRYGRAAGSLVAAVQSAKLAPAVRRVAFTSLPEELGSAAQTPGKALPGMIRVRKSPLRDSLYGGRLISLYFPGMACAWVDTLSTDLEGPDTAIFFASGNDVVMRIPSMPQAYVLQAEGRFLIDDKPGARRALERALALDPDFAGARILLAGLEAGVGNWPRATLLLRGLTPESVPAELRDYHAELCRVLGLGPAGTPTPKAPETPGP